MCLICDAMAIKARHTMEPTLQVEPLLQRMGARSRPDNTTGDGSQKQPGKANAVYSDGGQKRPGRAVTDGDGASKPHAKTTAGPSPQDDGGQAAWKDQHCVQ